MRTSAPHRWLEALAGACLPSDRRDDVLGDLCERYRSPAWYLLDAVQIVPIVAVCHIRRSWTASATRGRGVLTAWLCDRLLLSGLNGTAFPSGRLVMAAWAVLMVLHEAPPEPK